jgi:hypothetical protein
MLRDALAPLESARPRSAPRSARRVGRGSLCSRLDAPSVRQQSCRLRLFAPVFGGHFRGARSQCEESADPVPASMTTAAAIPPTSPRCRRANFPSWYAVLAGRAVMGSSRKWRRMSDASEAADP